MRTPVLAGTVYLLIDDVTWLGGTLAEQADYIQAAGGQVGVVITMVSAGSSPSSLKPW